ncbi:SRPBCC family protein [Pseudoalteromonas sp.]|uniref:SRPBCC family protein n=1 Tax=Pseudoalteromonas sp. TaxID=53249 RepID=UPI003565D242
MISVNYQKAIKATPDQIFTKLIDHPNLDQFFNAKFAVIKEQDDGEPLGGKGCIRKISIFGVSFLEEIIAANEKEIRYRVLNDFPVKNHLGVISFQTQKHNTTVSYCITCQSPWYLPRFILRKVLAKDIRNCLDNLGAMYDPR